jgi:hypothetical protein
VEQRLDEIDFSDNKENHETRIPLPDDNCYTLSSVTRDGELADIGDRIIAVDNELDDNDSPTQRPSMFFRTRLTQQ